jgi:phage-related minor tail protein
MTEERRIQLVAEVDTTRTRAGFSEIGQQASTMASSVERSGDQAQRAVSDIGSGADRSARQVEAAQRNLIGSIQRTTAAMEAGSRTGAGYYEVLARQRGVDPAVLAPYLAQLRAVEAAQVAANNALGSAAPALGRVGVSAAQTAAALRGVPAQLTDIVTSIQGGQAPLTVFLQQGGQLRDMFGSAGAAARALGGYVVSLVTPFTIAAGAAGVLVYAYSEGSKEAQEFNRALIVSGNAAGTTADQLSDMARAIRQSSGGTQGAAAAALAALASTGRVSVENLRAFGAAATQAQKAAVQGVDETAKAFADLGKTPLQTSLRLNEQYRFLTGALYAQIKALQDQGREEEAGEAAQKAYSSALTDRSAKMVANLGIAEKAWQGVKGAAKGAWDAMLDVGRVETPEAEISRLQAKILKASKPAPVVADKDVGSVLFAQQQERFSGREEARGNLDADKARVAVLQAQVDAKLRIAAIDAGRNKLDEADLEWSKQVTSNLDRQEQLKSELKANQARGLAAGASDKAINDEAIKIQKKYSDIYNDGINSQIEAIKRRGAVEDIVSKRSLDLLNANKAAGIVSEQAYIEQVAALELAEFAKRKDRLQQELELTKGKQNSQQAQKALSGQIAEEEARATSRQIQLTNDLYVLQTKANQDVFRQVLASTAQRQSLNAALEVEYQLYGKSSDAREQAMVSVKSELELRKKITDAIAANKPLTDEHIAQLRAEKGMLDEVTRSTIAQTKALGYAQQLHDTNERFAAESIADEKQRAAAILEIDAKVWRERIELAGEGTEAQKKLQQEFDTWYANRQLAPVIDQWKKVISNLDDNFQTGFRDMLTSGQSTWSSFAKSISNTLKTALADALYQTFIKKYVLQVVTGLAGAISGGDVAAALGGGSSSGSALGAFSTAASLFSAGKTIYSGFSSGIATTLGTQMASLGTTFGSSAVQGFGMGLSSAGTSAVGKEYLAQNVAGYSAGSSAAAAIPIIGWIIAGMQAAAGFRAQGFDPNNGTTSNTGKVVGAVPLLLNKQLQQLGVGSALANILTGASINTRLFGRANPVIESQGLQGTINTSGITATGYANILEKGGFFRSDKRYTNTAAIDSTTDASFDSTIQAMVAAVKGFGKAMGEETSRIDGYTKSFKFDLTGDATKDQQLINDLFTGIGNDLSNLLVPAIAALTKEGENSSTALQRLAGDYTAIDAVLGAIGMQFGAVGIGSLQARENLLTLSGGLDKFASQADYFSQNYLSESERVAQVVKALNTSFADLGVTAIPKTRDEFKALVLGLDLTTESGQKMYAGLMGLASGFTIAADATAAAITKAQDAAKVTAGLNDQIYDLSHSDAEALARQRAAELGAMSATDAELQKRIYALTDEKTALQAAKDAADALASINAGYQQQIDALLKANMSAAQVREMEIKGMNASTVALYDQLAGLKAKAAAEQAAAAAIKQAQESAAVATQSLGNALVSSITAAQNAAKAFRDLNDSLLVGENSTLSPEQRYAEAKRQFATADSSHLQAAEKAFLDASKALGRSELDYQRDFAAVIARNSGEASAQDAAVAGIVNFWRSYVTGNRIDGSHLNGLEKVPFDGYIAKTHKDEAILTAPQARAWRAGGDAALISEVKRLGDKLDRLHAATEATALNTSGTTRILKGAVINGVLQTEAAES